MFCDVALMGDEGIILKESAVNQDLSTQYLWKFWMKYTFFVICFVFVCMFVFGRQLQQRTYEFWRPENYEVLTYHQFGKCSDETVVFHNKTSTIATEKNIRIVTFVTMGINSAGNVASNNINQ